MTFPAAGVATADNQTNGNQKVQVVDTTGVPVVSSTPHTGAKSSALEASKVLKSGAGTFFGASVRVDSTLTADRYYILIIDAAALPANGSVTLLDYEVFDHVTSTLDYIQFDDDRFAGISFTDGCVVALSSTFPTLTIGGAYLLVKGRVA